MDPVECPDADAVPMQQLMGGGQDGRDLDLEASARAIIPDDLASIIYTSGTTGTSKGVQLTHGNLTSNVLNSLNDFDVRVGDVSVSFLPLSHVTARHADIALLHRGVTLAYCPFFEQLPQVLTEVLPTVFVAVPRVYEKIYGQVEQKAKGFPTRAIYRWALRVGRAHSSKILAGRGTHILRVEAGSQTGVFESAGPHGWQSRDIRVGRCPSGQGIGGVVRQHRDPNP